MRLTFFFLFISIALIAQPTISKEQYFRQGIDYPHGQYDLQPADFQTLLHQQGASCLWDFRVLNSGFLYQTDTLRRLPAPSNYPYYSNYYDTSTILIEISSNFNDRYYFHFLDKNDTIYNVGGGGFGVQGSIESTFQRWDGHFLYELHEGMTMGTTWTQAFAGSWLDASGSDTHYLLDGIFHAQADGYGQAILANGDTIDQVLRVLRTIEYRDSNALFGVTLHSDTVCTWYAAGYSCPLAHLKTGGTFAMLQAYWGSMPVTVYELGAAQQISPVVRQNTDAIRLYAHQSQLSIQTPETAADYAIECYDLNGRLWYKTPIPSGFSHISLSDLPVGNYLVAIKSGGQLLKSQIIAILL